jgi:hypothetical protein
MSKTMTLDAIMHDDGINAHTSRPEFYDLGDNGMALVQTFSSPVYPSIRIVNLTLDGKPLKAGDIKDGQTVHFNQAGEVVDIVDEGADILPFGAESDEEDDCIHEDYEIDILTGRATCDGCGETWTASDAQMQRHEELSRQGMTRSAKR